MGQYECEMCCYKTSRTDAYNIHLTSRKHINKKKAMSDNSIDDKKKVINIETIDDDSLQLLMKELIHNINDENSKIKSNTNKSYVYIIKVEHGNFYKIGKSADPKARLSDLQTANYSNLELIVSFACKDSYRLEKEAHRLFKEKNTRGEWFEMSFAELYRAIIRIQMKCNKINLIKDKSNKLPSKCLYCGQFNVNTDFTNHTLNCVDRMSSEKEKLLEEKLELERKLAKKNDEISRKNAAIDIEIKNKIAALENKSNTMHCEKLLIAQRIKSM